MKKSIFVFLMAAILLLSACSVQTAQVTDEQSAAPAASPTAEAADDEQPSPSAAQPTQLPEAVTVPDDEQGQMVPTRQYAWMTSGGQNEDGSLDFCEMTLAVIQDDGTYAPTGEVVELRFGAHGEVFVPEVEGVEGLPGAKDNIATDEDGFLRYVLRWREVNRFNTHPLFCYELFAGDIIWIELVDEPVMPAAD